MDQVSSLLSQLFPAHLSPQALTWVWAMTLITWQYFFMLLKSFSNCFLPSSSCHFLQYLVKAFFLDLCLQEQSRDKVWLSPSSIPREVGWAEGVATSVGFGSLPASNDSFPLASGAWSSSDSGKIAKAERSCHEFQSTLTFTLQKTKDCKEMSNNNRKKTDL